MRKYQRCAQQRGAALIIALLMLIVLLMLGISAMNIGLQSEKMGRNLFDRQIAWHTAEAALLDAEYEINTSGSPRFPLFDTVQATDPLHPLWRRMGASDDAPGVIYGHFSGRIMQTGIGSLPVHRARYLIEILPPDASKPPADLSRRYRVSALGFGPEQNTQVMLQSIYRRQTRPSEPADPIPTPASVRLSWREITTWEPV